MLSKTAFTFAALIATLALSASAASTPPSDIPKVGSMKLFANDDAKAKAQPKVQVSDDKIFWLATGTGSCNIDYRDVSMVACLDNYWMNNTLADSCQRYVKVTNPETKVSVQVQALDTCGGGVAFGDNDIYLSKRPYLLLSGEKGQSNLDAGHLVGKDGKPLQVQWEFVQESCEGCWSGIFARDGKGREDKCDGKDALGKQRCGRKTGNDRIGSSLRLQEVCTSTFQCPEETF